MYGLEERGKLMGAATLPYEAIEHEEEIRKLILDEERKLVPSIKLDLPQAPHLSTAMLTLNDVKQVERANQPLERNEQLQLHGIPVNEKTKLVREYLFFIFQTEVLTAYCSREQTVWLANHQKKRKRYRRVKEQDRPREYRRAKRLAIRSIYALGLDYGMVRIVAGTGDKFVVSGVSATPAINDEGINAFISALKDYVAQCLGPKIEQDQIVLGADPEFVMIDTEGKLVIASDLIPVRGEIGCDAIWIGENRSNKPLFELRPAPTADPKAMVVNIYRLLTRIAKKTRNVPGKWLAGAMPWSGFPLGGHIHYSGIKPNFKLFRALDNYMALLFVIAEDVRGIGRRPKYGYLGDYRFQPYGGFEYRTPPSWLISPVLTKGVFALAKVIAGNYRTLPYFPLNDPEMQRAYYFGRKALIYRWLPTLWEKLKKCEEYSLYQKYLDELFHYLLSGETWDEMQDFRKVWHLPPYRRVLHQKKTL
ncbi:putative amidoligase domain-containing protein [Laceyella putida]|uniref:PhiEco32-like amidoligase-type 2 protein n=1 Tax=Laceyella putida TaxID=110101 RepID=A0ABW2RKM3_9BACL